MRTLWYFLFATTLTMLLLMPQPAISSLALAAVPGPVPSSALCHGYNGNTTILFVKKRSYQSTDWNDLLNSVIATNDSGSNGQPISLQLQLSTSRSDSWSESGGLDVSATINEFLSIGGNFGLSHTSVNTYTFGQSISIPVPAGHRGYLHVYPTYMVYVIGVTRRTYGQGCHPTYQTIHDADLVGKVVIGPNFIPCIWDPKHVSDQDPCHRSHH